MSILWYWKSHDTKRVRGKWYSFTHMISKPYGFRITLLERPVISRTEYRRLLISIKIGHHYYSVIRFKEIGEDHVS